MTSTTQLTKEFLDTFNITEVIEQKPKSGQKQVHIVKCDHGIVALKIIPSVDERIIRELRICDEFSDNKGIPDILSIEKYGDELIVFEEYIKGHDLHLVKHDYLNNSDKVKNLIYSLAKILEPVWEKNYVHRDLKPQNIIIRDDGSPVVLDFGIARDLDDDTITPSGFQPFTWAFASPEQYFYKKDLISYRTDFFCLGIIAFYLYTGNLPFGKSKVEVAERFEQEQIVFNLPDLSLNSFLNSVLKYRVAERPRNFENFIKVLGL